MPHSQLNLRLIFSSLILALLLSPPLLAQPAKQPPPLAIYPEVAVPGSEFGVKLDDKIRGLALNLYPHDERDNPNDPVQIYADVDGVKNQELKIRDTKDGKTIYPLRQLLVRLNKEYPADFQVVINAPATMKFSHLQPVLIACAEAGVVHFGFVTKSTGKDKGALQFLPGQMPVKKSGKKDGEDVTPAVVLEAFITSRGDNEFKVWIDNVTYENGVSADGKTLPQIFADKRKALEATGRKTENAYIVLAPKPSTRYAHILTVYQSALAAKWPLIGFQAAEE